VLNVWLVTMTMGDWMKTPGSGRLWLEFGLMPALAGVAILLLWVTFEPVLPGWIRHLGRAPIELPQEVASDLPTLAYRKILVPLDHTSRDREALAHAVAMAKLHGAKLYLLHVEEGVTSQMYGPLSSTAEVAAGQEYFQGIADRLAEQEVEAELVVRHSQDPQREIVRYARELHPDLVVMGAHGHHGLKDVIFGATINAVRHKLKAPLLVVRDEV